MKRRFIDAPSFVRCYAAVSMRDGTFAQCGRRKVDGFKDLSLCEQHRKMFCHGAGVRLFSLADYPLVGWNVPAEDPGPLSASRRAHKKTAEYIADALALDNPRFDRVRFLKACGVTK